MWLKWIFNFLIHYGNIFLLILLIFNRIMTKRNVLLLLLKNGILTSHNELLKKMLFEKLMVVPLPSFLTIMIIKLSILNFLQQKSFKFGLSWKNSIWNNFLEFFLENRQLSLHYRIPMIFNCVISSTFN